MSPIESDRVLLSDDSLGFFLLLGIRTTFYQKVFFMRRIILTIIAGCILLSVPSHPLASEFSTKGSIWLGGGFDFNSFKDDFNHERLNTIQISPILRYFPADHLMVGPSLSWSGVFLGSAQSSSVAFGIEVGQVGDIKGLLYPYYRTGISWTTFSGLSNEVSTGFVLPVSLGVIIPAGRCFGVQIEPGFTYTQLEKSEMNTISVSIGICGIGEKSAISIMQNFSRQSFFSY